MTGSWYKGFYKNQLRKKLLLFSFVIKVNNNEEPFKVTRKIFTYNKIYNELVELFNILHYEVLIYKTLWLRRRRVHIQASKKLWNR